MTTNSWENMASIKKARSCCYSRVDTLYQHLRTFSTESTENIALLDLDTILGIQETIGTIEHEFEITLHEAQAFHPSNKLSHIFQQRECAATDEFYNRAGFSHQLAHRLFAMKRVQLGLAKLSDNIITLEKSLTSLPDGDHSYSFNNLQSTLVYVQGEYDYAQIPITHPIKQELDACTTKINTLVAEAKTKSIYLQNTSSCSTPDSKSSTPEATLQSETSAAEQLVATHHLPGNPSQDTTSKSSTPEATLQSETSAAEQLTADSQVFCSTASRSSTPKAADLSSPPSHFADFEPIDFDTVESRRTRSTTTARNAFYQLEAILANNPEEISLTNLEEVDRILNSITVSETIFIQAMRDAQNFSHEEDNNYYLIEESIEDSFHRTVQEARALGNQLLSLKAISNDLSKFHSELEEVQPTLSTIILPEKKSDATTQDETSHHKPQKRQLNSVDTSTTSLPSLLGPPPTMPSLTTSFQSRPSTNSTTSSQSILGPPPRIFSYSTSPSSSGPPLKTPNTPNLSPSRLLNHSRHHNLALDSESEAQRAPLPKRLPVYQPHPGSLSTTLSNSKTDSRSANSTEESNIPLMPAKPQNQSDGSDSTCRPTSLLPSQEPGTQQTDPEEEVTSSLKNCDQPQLTSSLCSSAKDEDTLTTPINSQSVSRNDILEQQPAALQPPIMMTSTRHILGEAILPQTLSTECQTPQQISLPPAATRSQPPAINPIHHISSEVILPQIPSTECQAPQRIRLLQATTIFQQNISREHSGEIASLILQSTQLNLHQAPSLLEKLDTVKLTRLFFNQQPHPISNLPSTNNRLLINTVSSNPVTPHYWIDASIYLSWLKDQFTKRCSPPLKTALSPTPPDTSTECQTPQQIPLSAALPSTHRVTLPKNPSVKCNVALASVLLGENPSGEVDDYDNYYYYNRKTIY